MDKSSFNAAPAVRPPKRLNVLPENPQQGCCGSSASVAIGRFPNWLHRPMPRGSALPETREMIEGERLHTVCEEAKCPNRLDCWSRHTATFLVLGKACSRSCGFCEIDFAAAPPPPDPEEPLRVAASVRSLGLNHVVITQVARDDLEDGGAAHLVAIVEALRADSPHVTVELLTSDLGGCSKAWDLVISSRPDIFNHNIETVRLLSPKVRHKATYDRTLALLSHVHSKGLLVKSGIMVGLGETREQVEETLRDLKAVGCSIVTMGQYLQPSRRKLPVRSFVTPEQFEAYSCYGRSIGIPHMYCAPFMRSSYNAAQLLQEARQGAH